MGEREIRNRLLEIVGAERILFCEPMKKHTTFRIGGNAAYFAMPDTVEMLQELVEFCKKESIPYFIMGNGSNLLVSDSGYDGVVIQLCKHFGGVTVEGKHVRAQAGALLSQVAGQALEAGLKGFEFAAGIPGTVGGAIVMNAGAYGGEMKQVVSHVKVLDKQGSVQTLAVEELEFGYRTSVVMKRSYIVLEALFSLEEGERAQIKAKMEELREARISKQPLEFPSAGSTFKRPEGNYAGKMIMEAGFRGYQVGGARVSDKHCGFVVNAGDATARDVIELTSNVQKKVYEDTGVMLELEIKKLGAF